jgi:putative ABC transport system permease protein
VVIISNSIAKRYFAGRDPIGRRLKWGLPQSTAPWLTVVGVVGEVKQGALDVATQPHTYEPYAQGDDELVTFATGLNIAMRTAGNPAMQVAATRSQIWDLDKQLAISDVQTMADVVHKSMAARRFDTFLMSIFAAAALFMAAIGLYGVISYSVTQRIHEIGVRMALGAARRDVVRLVVGQGMTLTILGVAIGLAGSLGLTRLLSNMLYEVPATDPLTFLTVSLALIAVAFLASYIPSRRATRVDPIVALRYE